MRSGKLGDAFFPRLENRKGGLSLRCSDWALLYQKDFRAPRVAVKVGSTGNPSYGLGNELIISTTCPPSPSAE